MRKVLFAAVFSSFMFWSFISMENVSSQTDKPDDQKKSQENKKAPDFSKLWKNSENVLENAVIDDSDHYSSKWLRRDLHVSDIVAYVDVKEAKYSGRSSESSDCENNKGGGYCFYDLKAEVIEIYKGEIKTQTLEVSASADATYPKEYFLGEEIIFLQWIEGDNKQKFLVKLENSSRSLKYNVLEKMRNILNPQSIIDENDEGEPYSFVSIKKNFGEADEVIYADVISFKPDKTDSFGSEPFILKAKIQESFKGKLKAGQEIEYKDDLLYRPIRKEDLGKRIIYLEKKEIDGKVVYEKIDYTEGLIQHNILEKLRKLAKEK